MKIGMAEKQIAWNAINLAKRHLEIGDMDSVPTANYIIRDLDVTKAAGLSELAWAIHHDGSAHKNDVLGLIEHLIMFLEKD